MCDACQTGDCTRCEIFTCSCLHDDGDPLIWQAMVDDDFDEGGTDDS